MNFFKQSSEQARDALLAMPMQSRVISVMLAAAIAIGLAFLVRGTDSAASTFLFGGRAFGEQELDAIEMAFSSAGLSDWDREGRRIKVPRANKSEYLAALKESSSLPSTLQSSVQEAIDSTSVFESSDLMHARLQAAREADLGQRIAMFPDVKTATVNYDRGERRGLSQTRPQSASVMVVPEGNSPLPHNRILAIQEIVRASYAGMHSDDVLVSDTNGDPTLSLNPADHPLLRKQQETEALWKRKIRSALSAYPATIEVSAEIDPAMDLEKTSESYDPEGTTVSSQSRKTESSNFKQPNRGIPGAATNTISNRSASLDQNVQTSKQSDKQDEVKKVIGRQVQYQRLASLAVKSVSVTVGIPRSYFNSVYVQTELEKDPDKTIADLAPMSDDAFEQLKIKTFTTIDDVVSKLLPPPAAGDDRTTFVKTFVTPDLPPEPLPTTDTAKVALTWLAGSWQSIAMIFLALIALLVARSAARSSGETPPSAFQEGFGLELPQPPSEPEADDSDEAMTITGGNLKDELVTIVEGNPEVAANVIRAWVGDAA